MTDTACPTPLELPRRPGALPGSANWRTGRRDSRAPFLLRGQVGLQSTGVVRRSSVPDRINNLAWHGRASYETLRAHFRGRKTLLETVGCSDSSDLWNSLNVPDCGLITRLPTRFLLRTRREYFWNTGAAFAQHSCYQVRSRASF